MSEKDYISSGLIESYAVGAGSVEEKVIFEQLLASDEDLRKELSETEDCLDQLSYALAITPRKGLKNMLLENAPTRINVSKAVNWRMISGIAASISLILAFISVTTWGKYQALAEQNESLLAEKQILADNITKTKSQLDFLRDPASQTVQLAGTENASGSSLNVIINLSKREVFIDALKLPSIPEGKQFQLWAIVDGQPIDMGVFDPGASLLEMNWIDGAETFAVTIEPKGGNELPSLETLVVIGNLI